MKQRGFVFLLLWAFSLSLFAKNLQTEPHLTVHYWATKGSPFGHVALDVKQAQEHVYLSYAMRNERERDQRVLGPSETVHLPLLRANAYDQYKDWIRSGPYWERNPNYGKDYQIFTFNCAHAISNGLKFLDYNTGFSDHHFALRPSKVWKKAKSFHKHLSHDWARTVEASKHSVDAYFHIVTSHAHRKDLREETWTELLDHVANASLNIEPVHGKPLKPEVAEWMTEHLKEFNENTIHMMHKQFTPAKKLSLETIMEAAKAYTHSMESYQREFSQFWNF